MALEGLTFVIDLAPDDVWTKVYSRQIGEEAGTNLSSMTWHMQAELPRAIEEAGGSVTATTSLDNSCILICRHEGQQAWHEAQALGLPCVSPLWVLAALQKGEAVPYDEDWTYEPLPANRIDSLASFTFSPAAKADKKRKQYYLIEASGAICSSKIILNKDKDEEPGIMILIAERLEQWRVATHMVALALQGAQPPSDPALLKWADGRDKRKVTAAVTEMIAARQEACESQILCLSWDWLERCLQTWSLCSPGPDDVPSPLLLPVLPDVMRATPSRLDAEEQQQRAATCEPRPAADTPGALRNKLAEPSALVPPGSGATLSAQISPQLLSAADLVASPPSPTRQTPPVASSRERRSTSWSAPLSMLSAVSKSAGQWFMSGSRTLMPSSATPGQGGADVGPASAAPRQTPQPEDCSRQSAGSAAPASDGDGQSRKRRRIGGMRAAPQRRDAAQQQQLQPVNTSGLSATQPGDQAGEHTHALEATAPERAISSAALPLRRNRMQHGMRPRQLLQQGMEEPTPTDGTGGHPIDSSCELGAAGAENEVVTDAPPLASCYDGSLDADQDKAQDTPQEVAGATDQAVDVATGAVASGRKIPRGRRRGQRNPRQGAHVSGDDDANDAENDPQQRAPLHECARKARAGPLTDELSRVDPVKACDAAPAAAGASDLPSHEAISPKACTAPNDPGPAGDDGTRLEVKTRRPERRLKIPKASSLADGGTLDQASRTQRTTDTATGSAACLTDAICENPATPARGNEPAVTQQDDQGTDPEPADPGPPDATGAARETRSTMSEPTRDARPATAVAAACAIEASPRAQPPDDGTHGAATGRRARKRPRSQSTLECNSKGDTTRAKPLKKGFKKETDVAESLACLRQLARTCSCGTHEAGLIAHLVTRVLKPRQKAVLAKQRKPVQVVRRAKAAPQQSGTGPAASGPEAVLGEEPLRHVMEGSAKASLVVDLSSFHSNERQLSEALLRSIQLPVVSNPASHEYDGKATCIVAPSLLRVEKVLGTLASGGYIVKPAWIKASVTAGTAKPLRDYELDGNAGRKMSPGAACFWRRWVQAHGPAFAGWHVVIIEQDKPSLGSSDGGSPLSALRRIFAAGGAWVRNVNLKAALSVLEEAAKRLQCIVVLEKGANASLGRLQKVVASNQLPVVTHDFVMDWLALPQAELNVDQFLYGTSAPEWLQTAAANRVLADA